MFQLKSFLALAETGTVTGAADRLCLTQPAVTQQLQSLEKDLNVRLFERSRRGVVLTQAGNAFRDYVVAGLTVLEEGRKTAIEVEGGQAGQLLIGAGVTTSVFYLPEWLKEFQAAHPTVDVVVRTGRSAEVARMVVSREVDLGIVTSNVAHDALTIEPLFQEEIVLVMSGKAARGSYVTAEKLSQIPLIVFPRGAGFREYLERTFYAQGIGLRIKMESDSLEAIKSFVTVGLGASFLPARSVAAEVAMGDQAQVPVRGIQPLSRETSLIFRSAGHLNGAGRGFLAQMRRQYGTD